MHTRRATFYTALIAIFAALLAVPSTFFVDSFTDYFTFLARWSSGLTRSEQLDMTAPPAHTARYRPKKKPNVKLVSLKYRTTRARSVRLAADFNHWKPEFASFEKIAGSGWQLTLPLPAGRYRYLLEVDGELKTDSENPLSETFNGRTVSVLEVK
ncbi:MAG: hypothetical protein PHW69_00900 [Elusimicrobiaceae bacterium]|nr:hypothetical protein [Elusimicrobiaceae bacterium]